MPDDGRKCAFCDSSRISLISLFGKKQLVRQYYCHDCRSVFEGVKWGEKRHPLDASKKQVAGT